MSKMSIEWHERGLKNSIEYAKRKKKEIENLLEDLKGLEEGNEFIKKQIAQAKKQKKDGFDSDLFMKKQNPRYNVKEEI